MTVTGPGKTGRERRVCKEKTPITNICVVAMGLGIGVESC